MTTFDKIVEAAIVLASTQGLAAVKRNQLADTAGVGHGTINYYWDTMSLLREHVIRVAIDREILSIIAEGVATGHPVAVNECPVELKRKAVGTLI